MAVGVIPSPGDARVPLDMTISVSPVRPLLLTTSPAPPPPVQPSPGWQPHAAWGLTLLLVAGGFGVALLKAQQRIKALEKQQRFEQFKNRELKKRVQLSLNTIRKMEENPDLIHSREFNLDYLRMRMAEASFHNAIVNQVKNKVRDQIAIALRESQPQQIVGIATRSGRQISCTFDVEYSLRGQRRSRNGVLFRIQIRLFKLPMQPTSVTVRQVVECLEAYMSPTTDHATWQPTLQGRIVTINWDQSAKPTPLLVLEQLNDGTNVTFRTRGIA